jgi:hypothetical protein
MMLHMEHIKLITLLSIIRIYFAQQPSECLQLHFRHTLVQGTLAPEKLSALKSNNYTGKESNGVENGIQNENLVSVETIAATRIQTAFRAYKVC